MQWFGGWPENFSHSAKDTFVELSTSRLATGRSKVRKGGSSLSGDESAWFQVEEGMRCD
jgi:hypothetical protein